MQRVAIPADLALAAAERWVEVEEAMDRWRALGISSTRDDVEERCLNAMVTATGRSYDEILGDWLDWEIEAEEKREAVYGPS